MELSFWLFPKFMIGLYEIWIKRSIFDKKAPISFGAARAKICAGQKAWKLLFDNVDKLFIPAKKNDSDIIKNEIFWMIFEMYQRRMRSQGKSNRGHTLSFFKHKLIK